MRDIITNGKNRFIDDAGLFFIGIASLGYFLFYTYFAKLHIDLFFIKAPIFVGEIIFIICLCLFIFKWITNPKKLDAFTCLFLFYFGFVIIKTILGYFKWGSLSLRHSALFFYPLVAFFSFSFYRRDFFGPNKNLLIVLILLAGVNFFPFYGYSILTCLILLLTLVSTYPKNPVRLFLYFLLLIAFPYSLLFNTSRTFIVSNVLALIYISSGFLVISKIKRMYKFVFFPLFIFLILYGVIKISGSSELNSLVGFEKLCKVYNQRMELSRVNELAFVKPELDTRLYNEERGAIDQNQIRQYIKSLLVYLKNRFENFSILSNSKPIVSRSDVKQVDGAVLSQEPQEIVDTAKPDEHQKIVDTAKPEDTQGAKGLNKSGSRERGDELPYINSVFRIIIWKEALKELWVGRPVFGFDFGKPFRCHTLESLNWAIGEWSRDGWICIHNSYIDIVYRAGIFGILIIGLIITILIFLIVASFRNGSVTGMLLTGILVNWLIAASFLEILEMPYSAIPFWGLFGLTFAYSFKNKKA